MTFNRNARKHMLEKCTEKTLRSEIFLRKFSFLLGSQYNSIKLECGVTISDDKRLGRYFYGSHYKNRIKCAWTKRWALDNEMLRAPTEYTLHTHTLTHKHNTQHEGVSKSA